MTAGSLSGAVGVGVAAGTRATGRRAGVVCAAAKVEGPSHAEVAKFAKFVEESGVAEVSIRSGSFRLKITKSASGSAGTAAAAAAAAAAPVEVESAPVEVESAPVADGNLVAAYSVGTFRRSRGPAGSKPVVNEGQKVKAGQVVGYVFQLGSFVDITTENPGTLGSFILDDGEPVEYGEAVCALLD